MERTQVLELMSTLKLYGMRGAYDEVMATGIKRQHEPPKIVGDLLSAERHRGLPGSPHRAVDVRELGRVVDTTT